MIKKLGSLVLLLVLLTGCTSKPAYTEIVHDQMFRVEVPSDMKKTRSLNGDATLQLQNVKEELYLIVIKEDKEEINQLFEGMEGADENVFTLFSETTLEYLTSTLGELEPSELHLQESDRQDILMKTVDFTARIGGLNIYYKFAAFKGKEAYYQILTWTLKEYKEKNKAKMEDMVQSFKEIEK